MNRVCLSIQSLDLQFFFFLNVTTFIVQTKNRQYKIEQRMVERKTKTTKRKKKISAARL